MCGIYPLFSLFLLFTSLFLAIFSTTYPSTSLRYLRLALAIPASASCIALISRPLYGSPPMSSVTSGSPWAALGYFGLLRTLDICFISFWDRDKPRWLMKKRVYGGKVYKGTVHLPVAIPLTLRGRLLYAVDLLLALRGSSLLKDRVWDWAPTRIKNFHPMAGGKFYAVQLVPTLLWQYLWLDITNTINNHRSWDPSHRHPLTSLPVHHQIIYTASICLSLVLSISSAFNSMALVSLLFFRSHAHSWPPLFDSPFSSSSLGDLWINRWNTTYYNQFSRISNALLRIIPCGDSFRTKAPIKTTLVFTLSCLYQFLLLSTMTRSGPLEPSWGILKFMLLQPVGMLIERWVFFPLSLGLPLEARIGVRRAFGLIWVVWTGRWYCDGWIRMGLLDGAHGPRFSVVRGLLDGHWIP